ncbi:MAG: hypothetical protein SWO11_13810 [Thermodesulfobacteriota bacterium]|nr:hypothetical protein [Thermodesulfobacteriota bacterium]
MSETRVELETAEAYGCIFVKGNISELILRSAWLAGIASTFVRNLGQKMY